MLTIKPCMDYLPKRFSGVLVICKIVWDSRSNINTSVISRSFFELRACHRAGVKRLAAVFSGFFFFLGCMGGLGWRVGVTNRTPERRYPSCATISHKILRRQWSVIQWSCTKLVMKQGNWSWKMPVVSKSF